MTAVSWKSGISGNWTIAADWSTGIVPSVGDDVSIAVGGSYTVTIPALLDTTIRSLTISDTHAILAIDTGASGGGTDMTVTGALGNSGHIEIGSATLATATNVTVGALSNTGEIDLTGSNTVQASLLVEAAAPATLTGKYFLGGDALLGFEIGSITAIGSNAELSLTGSKARVALPSALGSNSALTTLGSNIGTFRLEGGAVVGTAVGFTNTGVVDVDDSNASGGSRLAIGGILSNGKTITIGNSLLSAATTVTAGNLANGGTINLTGSGAIQAALIVHAAAPTTLIGNFNLTGDALLDYASGAITSIGNGWTLSPEGPTAQVNIGATTGNSALRQLGGNLGTFKLENGAVLTTTASFTNNIFLDLDEVVSGGSRLTIGGTLTNRGTLNIGNSSLSTPTTLTAAGLVNTGSINLTGARSVQATLDITGAAPSILTGNNILSGDALLEYGSGAISEIAIGEKTSLNGPNARVALASAPSSNSALTTLTGVAGTFDLENGAAVAITGSLTNSGAIDVGVTSGINGSRLTIGGLLTNNKTINIGNTTLGVPTIVTVAGLSNPGAINLAGAPSVQATLHITGAAPSTLSGGTYNLTNDALLEYAGTGRISAIFGGTTLFLNGTMSRVALASAPNSNSALTTLASNAGTLRLDGGALVTTNAGVNFSNTASAPFVLAVDDTGVGGSRLAIGGTLTNSGHLVIGNAGIGAAAIVTAAGLSNTGEIDITGSPSVTFDPSPTGDADQAMLNVAGPAPGILNGKLILAGDALLEYGSGAITGIGNGATLFLNGATAVVALSSAPSSNSALTTLASNAGTLHLDGGTIVTTNAGVNFANSGLVQIDDAGNGGSRLTIGGTLTNNALTPNGIKIGNATLSTATIVKAAGLSNSGEIDISGARSVQATLNDTGAAPTTLTGTTKLTNDALLEFSSGGITGIGSGATLSLNGANARVAQTSLPGSNSALTRFASNAGTLDLENGARIAATPVGGTVNNTGTLGVDFTAGDGGSHLTIGGRLTNDSTIKIGNSTLSAPTTVTATNLSNSGEIDLTGTPFVQATLKVAGAAPTTLTGVNKLTNDALLEYGSGAITSISGGTTLLLSGAGARVALASALTTNSALRTLASNAGTFSPENGAVVATTVGLSNASTTDVDLTSAGGSRLTIGGALSNSGTFNIGNANSLTLATNVTASALSNLSGGKLVIAGKAAPATLTLTNASTDVGTITIGSGGVLHLGSSLTVSGSPSPLGLTLNGGTITGGSLAGTGVIGSTASSSDTLNSLTIASGATFAAGANSTLTVDHVTVDGALKGGGSAGLVFGVAGADTMTNISGFPLITLADGGANTLTLTGANFSGVSPGIITMYDGNANNTVSASTLPSADAIVVHAGTGTDTLTGGAGNDVFFAGGETSMTGHAGTNEFVFTDIGTNTIGDFGASTTNEIAFSNFGFSLGLIGASSTPTALPTGLEGSLVTGAFTTTAQRFAYRQSTGQLLFSADGSGSAAQVVASLTGDPALSASHLFFVT